MAGKENKKTILITTTVILISLISVVFFIKSRPDITGRQLLLYVPKDADAYIEFSLNNEGIVKQNEKVKAVVKNFSMKNELPISIWGEAGVERLGLISIKNKKTEKTERVWLIRTEQVNRLETLSLNNYYFSTLARDTAVISLSLEAMNMVRDKTALNSFEVTDKILPDKENYLSYGFVKWGSLLKTTDSQHQLLLESVKIRNNEPIYFELNNTLDEIGFSLNLPIETEYDRNDKINFPIGCLGNSILFNGFKLAMVKQILEDELNKEREGSWEMLEQHLKDKYEVDINQLYNFFEQSGIMIIQPKSIIDRWSDLTKLDNYYYALVIKRNDTSDNQLETTAPVVEKFVQNYLAFKYPQIKNKFLPDGTTGRELVAEPGQFVIKPDQHGNKIKVINRENFEFNYFEWGEIIIFSNSYNLVSEILSCNEDETDKESNKWKLIIDPKIFDYDLLNIFSKLYISSRAEGNSILLEGKAIIEDVHIQ